MNPIAACLSLLLAGCAAMPEAGTSIPDGSEFALVPGQSVLLADHSRLTYTRLVNDSRCAPGRRCVWEGDAELSLRWQPARGDAQDLRLHTSSRAGADNARIGTRTLRLTGIERGAAPEATLRIDAD